LKMKKLYIIKIGGNVIDQPDLLEGFLLSFSGIEGLKILVHGGGKSASELAKKLGISQAMVNGKRITDSETLKITTMIYAGSVNKSIVASLQSKKVNALGLSGADLSIINAEKRKMIDIDYGFVGDITPSGINTKVISGLLESDVVPVFSAITHDGKGQLLNTNADTIASVMAVAMTSDYEVHLNYCFEKPGVLEDPENDDSLLERVTQTKYKQLLQKGSISKGMIPKMENAFSAIQNGVSSVIISHADELTKITGNEYKGTTLVA
jgi:acetylglutamate kinase